MPQNAMHKGHEPFLGVLMLDTAFPRILGDAGNMNSYPFAARAQVVTGAGALDIVQDAPPNPDLVKAFCRAAEALERRGAVGLVSTCGFLIHIQDQIAGSVQIPVMVSALSLYPTIRKMICDAPIGVLTAASDSLGPNALSAAGIGRADVEIEGFEDCPAFSSAVLQTKDTQSRTLDAKDIEAAAIIKAQAIVERRRDTRAFLLECGNLPPYATAIRRATGRPVFSILDAARMMWPNPSGH